MNRDEFRDRLNDLGMTPSQFARETGWSQSTVRQWGTGTPVPRPARKMVDLLKQTNRRPPSDLTHD